MMKLDYEVAGIRLRFESEYLLKQSGFAPLFLSEFDEPECAVSVGLADVMDTAGDILYKTETNLAVRRDGEVHLFSKNTEKDEYIFDISGSGGRRKGLLSSAFFDPCADVYFLWRYIDLSGILTGLGRLPLHCSFVAYGDEALLFCGPSGIGKSTQADLWKVHAGAEILNGDRAAVYREGETLLAASLPVAGTSGICVNKTLPVKAFVILSQSGVNTCARLYPLSAFSALMSNAAFEKYSREQLDRVSGMCSRLAEEAPVFSLACTPDERAVTALLKALG